MCKTCGCDSDHVVITPVGGNARSTEQHSHHALHSNHTHKTNPLDSGTQTLALHVPLLAENRQYADQVRACLHEHNTFAINLLSSPGAGKTQLLVESLQLLKREKSTRSLMVIEGDQQTQQDAKRIAETGVTAVQINTGKGCHLDGHMLMHAFSATPPPVDGTLFIENVGNLVCPAFFDLGEHQRVVILSVTEGDDKPVKYPDAFANADLMIISKIDLLPYVDFDTQRCIDYARTVKPDINVLMLSAKTGDGMAAWIEWLNQHVH